MARRKYTDYDQKSWNAVAMIIVVVLVMPIAGLMLLGSKSAFLKVIGGILVVLGVMIWIKLAAG